MNIETLSLLLGGGLFGFVSSMIVLLSGRRKNRAEIERLLEDTEKASLQNKLDLENRINNLQDRYENLYNEREKERDAKRNELNNLHDAILILQKNLQNVNDEKVIVSRELSYQRSANAEKQKEIDLLKVSSRKHGVEISEIQKQTDELASRADLKRS